MTACAVVPRSGAPGEKSDSMKPSELIWPVSQVTARLVVIGSADAGCGATSNSPAPTNRTPIIRIGRFLSVRAGDTIGWSGDAERTLSASTTGWGSTHRAGIPARKAYALPTVAGQRRTLTGLPPRR